MKSLYRFANVLFRLLAGVLALSIAGTQTAFAAQSPDVPKPASATAPAQPAAAAPMLEVPAGTVIPLTLVNQIKSKSTKVGDTIRAQVAFPIAAGMQVAIPAGTVVEGVVTSTNQTAQKKTKKKTRLAQAASTPPEVQIHFVRLVYANGYVVNLDATNTEASNHGPDGAVSAQFNEASLLPVAGAGSHIAFYGGEGFTSSAKASQPPYPYPPLPPLPPLPEHHGPSPALMAGLFFGVPVVLGVVGILLARHGSRNSDSLLYDVGWQFQMTLSTPLAVDAAQATAAAAVVPAQ